MIFIASGCNNCYDLVIWLKNLFLPIFTSNSQALVSRDCIYFEFEIDR